MRKAGIVFGVIVVLIVIALAVVPRFVNVNTYRPRIEAELQSKLGRPVKLGQMHLSLLPTKVTVDNAVIGGNPQFESGPFATVEQLSASLKFWPLLHGAVDLNGVTLVRPHVELVRNAQGVWNFSTLGKNGAQQPAQPSSGKPQPAPQSQPQQPQSQQGGAPAVAINNLQITDGQIAVTDEQAHRPRQVFDHIDLKLNNFAPDKNFDFALSAHLPGKGTETISLSGNAGPINNSNTMATPVNGTLKLQQVSIGGLKQYLNTQALAGVDGVVSGATSIKNQNGTIAAQGALTVNDPVVRNVKVGYPVSADYNVSDDLNGGMVTFKDTHIKLGSTPLGIDGSLNTKPTPMQADLKLTAQNVSLTEAARLASAFGVAFAPNTNVSGNVSADISARGPVTQPALNGTMSAHDLSVSGANLSTQVKVPSVQLALTPQQIKSDPFNATAANTNLALQFTMTNYTTPSPLVDATAKTNNAEIQNLLAIGQAAGVTGLQGVKGTGFLTLDAHANGPIHNANAMKINGTGQIRQASIQAPSLHQPLNIANANLQFTSNSATINNLAASLAGTNATGNMTVQNFAAPQVKFALNADKVNVAALQQAIGSAPATPPQQQNGKKAQADTGARLVFAAYDAAPSAAPAATAGILDKMTGGGTLSAGTIQYDQLTLSNVHTNVALNHGVITMSPLTAQLYDGTENGAIVADTRTTPMTVQVKSNLQKVQANPLISSLSNLKNTIYGMLAANTQASFRAANANDITHTLNGTLTFNLNNGRIVGLDMLNELAAVGKFAGVRKNSQAVTDLTSLVGHFNIVNGVASTNDLRAQLAGASLAGNGTINLASQALDMAVTAVLSKGMSQQVGGTGIGGFMQTALANNQGELVIPVMITGTFQHPQVAPDLNKLAQMKLHNLLPTSGNPGQLSAGILGSVLKGGKGGPAGAAGGVGGLLGTLTGQQQNQQQGQQQQGGVASPQGQQPNAQQQQQQQQNPANAINQAVQGILGGGKKKQQNQNQNPPPQ